VTGTGSFLGSRVLRTLARAHGNDAVLAVDVAPPSTTLPDVGFRMLDLTQAGADQRLLDALREENVTRLFHFAFFTNPQRDRAYAHELESIGTLNLLAAAAAAKVEHVVMRSFTAVYGAHGKNPNFLSEQRGLVGGGRLAWLVDKVEAETHAAHFLNRYPALNVSVLRFAPLFGPAVRNFYTAVFDKRVVPVLMGFDPLVQLLHPDDAMRAIEQAAQHRPRGAVNVVPARSIPLLSALHLAEKVPVPIPHPLAYAATDALWAAGLAEAPSGFLDYVRYLFVADGQRAAREMDFVARHSSRDALLAYLRQRHPAAGGGDGLEAREEAPSERSAGARW
jgi:UDP-glucose 4-epimerase